MSELKHGLGRNPSLPDDRDWSPEKLEAMIDEGIAVPVQWEDKVVLNQGQTGHCHPAGTLVRLSNNSLCPIEKMRVLGKVVSAEGNECTVTAVIAHEHKGEMLNIRLRGLSDVRCTPEHPILTDKGYVPAGDLQVGDVVAVPRRVFEGARTELYFDEVVVEHEYARRAGVEHVSSVGGVTTIVTAPPKVISLDAKFGRLLGLYLAEGHNCCASNPEKAHGSTTKFSFGAHERDTLVAETVELAKDVLGVTARLQERVNNKVINVVFGGKHWALMFGRLCGEGAGDKCLSEVLDGPREFREAILMGWIDGDGHRRRTSTMGVTVSKRLALQMHAIANDLGLRPTLRKRMPVSNSAAKTRQVAWEVEWGENNLSELTNVTPQSTLTDSATWRRISEISREEFIGSVFNLEVDNNHSYIADGVGSHNCVGYGCAGFIAASEAAAVGDTTVTNALGDKIYYAAKILDGEPGAENGSTVRSGAKALQQMGYIDNYAFGTFKQGKEWIAKHGPCIIGTRWDYVMEAPDSKGYVHPDGDSAGGHCTLWRGTEMPDNVGRNSWGDWGPLHGDYKITDEDMKDILSYGGEIMMAVKKVATPTPTPTPTPDWSGVKAIVQCLVNDLQALLTWLQGNSPKGE